MPQPKKYQSNAQRQAAYRKRWTEEPMNAFAAQDLPGSTATPRPPGEKRWALRMKQACLILENISEEMKSYYQSRSERWQESERGEAFDERSQAVEELRESLLEIQAMSLT